MQELTRMTMTMKSLLSCEFHFDQEIMSKILDNTITITRYYQVKRVDVEKNILKRGESRNVASHPTNNNQAYKLGSKYFHKVSILSLESKLTNCKAVNSPPPHPKK